MHLGWWPWTSDSTNKPVDPDNYTNLPTWDKVQLRAIGPVPILGAAFAPGIGDWVPQTMEWLAGAGFREATVRCVLDAATSDNPIALTGDMKRKAQDLAPAIGRWLTERTNFTVWWQIDNEPDLERRNQAPGEYASNINLLIAELEAIFPGQKGRFLRAPLSQDSPLYDSFLAALLPGYRAQRYTVGHRYWGREYGAYVPGAKGTPEWLAQVTGHPVIVSECGNLSDKHDVDYVFQRWIKDPAILRFHWWKFSGESYAQDNFDTASVNYMRDFAHDVYRDARVWPLGAGGSGDLDRWALREHISPQYELCKRMRARVAAGDWAGAASDAKEIEDRAQAIWDDFDLANARPG